MKIIKNAGAQVCAEVSEKDLELINTFTKRELAAEEVFTFAVTLCDNEIDRDYERFSVRSLEELAELFVGKTGIFDHEWRSGNQVARIYRTEVVRGRKMTAAGEEYVCLKAWAYMLRSEKNAELIAEIEAGIKKETSIGCAVERTVCSICGEEMGAGKCSHIKGQEYGGKLCYATLDGAVDAYEWSFVAVPAQKNAGVTKAIDITKGLGGFVESCGEGVFVKEFEVLKAEAALGRRYLEMLRDEVRRLGLVCDRQLYESIKCAVDSLGEEELLKMKASFEKRISEKMPLGTQLRGAGETTRFDGGEYRI